METEKFSHAVRLIDSDGRESAVTLDCETDDWTEGKFRRCRCIIRLQTDRCDIAGEGCDYFDALCRVREGLEPLGMHLLCYGASRNVFPSGMARDMAPGLKAYRMRMGQPARQADIVSIFADGPDVEPVSVQQQREFWEAWLRSNRYPPVTS